MHGAQLIMLLYYQTLSKHLINHSEIPNMAFLCSVTARQITAV